MLYPKRRNDMSFADKLHQLIEELEANNGTIARFAGFDRSQLEFFVKEFKCKIIESEIIPSENLVDKKLPVICMILTKNN